MNHKEYNRTMGINSVDIGSRNLLLKQVIKLARRVGYNTGGFHAMPKDQLKAIYYNLLNKNNGKEKGCEESQKKEI